MAENIQEEREIIQVQPAGGTVEKIIDFLVWYAKRWLIESIMTGIIIVIIVMTVTGTPLSHITDKWFDLKNTELTQTYELQKQSFEYMQTEIKPQLDTIVKRLDNIDWRVGNLEARVTKVESDLEYHRKTGK